MENIADRTCQRVSIHKGLSYNGYDANRNVIERYMGVALNISQNGIQIETDRLILTKHILLMFFDYNGNYIATKGEVVYSRTEAPGTYRTGIKFDGTVQENLRFVRKLLRSYHYQRRVPLIIS